jgi:diguanylate cyclase (GGDEF)-like protein
MEGLMRWEEAYRAMTLYAAAYERARTIEGDRAAAESSALVAINEERRRAQHFERLAMTDPLTGLPNRRHAERWLAEHASAISAELVAPDELCVAIADIDHFKGVNDTFSHDAGDLVLQRFAAVLREAFDAEGGDSSATSLAARLGGEEFLLAWSGLSMEAALRRGRAFCERLRQTSFADIVGPMRITASLGLACSSRPVDPGELLRLADRCLYEAKRSGRDRVVGTRAR